MKYNTAEHKSNAPLQRYKNRFPVKRIETAASAYLLLNDFEIIQQF